MTAEIAAVSTEYVAVAVRHTEAGDAVDLSSTTVEMAFVAGAGSPTTWYTASWDTDPSTTPPTYRARCLVGPDGTTELVAGTWVVWVRVTDSPEIAIRRTGQLRVI